MAARPALIGPEDVAETAYSLSLLAEFTHSLDSLPTDISRNFADLRELDAVLSSSMHAIAGKIARLTQMIQQGDGTKEERLWLLAEVAEDANRLKLGGEDKIRVACQAADNLRLHSSHLRDLASVVPRFQPEILLRNTVYPHVSAISHPPVNTNEHGRRRKATTQGSAMPNGVAATEASPQKRKRVFRDDDDQPTRGGNYRKEKTQDGRARNGRRRQERAPSPAESQVSITSYSHNHPHHHASSRTPVNSTSKRKNATGGGAGAGGHQHQVNGQPSSYNHPHPNSHHHHPHYAPYDPHMPNANGGGVGGSRRGQQHVNANSDMIGLPPAAHHPSIPMPYQNGSGYHRYEHHPAPPSSTTVNGTGGAGDWGDHPGQGLEGPGMPMMSSRNGSVVPASHLGGNGATPSVPLPSGVEDNDGDPDGEMDDGKTYCFCERVSYGNMIGCDAQDCPREWFHLECVGLSSTPEGTWYCDSCRQKNGRGKGRATRGGKRKGAGRGGGRATASAS